MAKTKIKRREYLRKDTYNMRNGLMCSDCGKALKSSEAYFEVKRCRCLDCYQKKFSL